MQVNQCGFSDNSFYKKVLLPLVLYSAIHILKNLNTKLLAFDEYHHL